MNIQSFEELKMSGSLPSPSGVGMRILQLTRHENYSAEEMGEAIMTDSALTGRILMLANSAAKSGAEPATTVSESIMRLGGRAVRDLALAFSLVSKRRPGMCRAFDYEGYWSRSLARAVCAQTLSRVTGYGKPEEAYICGLLGSVGSLALASVYTDQYADILEQGFDENDVKLLEAETEAFSINHSEVGECMLKDWGLPESFAQAVAGFSRSRGMRQGEKSVDSLANLLRHANVIAEAMVVGDDADPPMLEGIGRDLDILRTVLEMDTEVFANLCQTCVREWVAWGDSLEISTAEGLEFTEVFERIDAARAALADGWNGPVVEEPKARSKVPGSVPLAGDNIRILAVDDDPVSLLLLTKHLERSGYDVVLARGGQEGLKVALKTTPDIVIADCEMPGFSGLELCTSLRKTDAGRSMYFLLLTGRDEEELVVAAFDHGVDDFVTKPFVPKILNARIKGGIRLARLQRKVEADKQIMMRQVAELSMLTRKLRTASLTDTLTELPNRRYAFKRLETEWASAKRTKRSFALMMVDIDHFKNFNDNYGHDVGDEVLKIVAKQVQNALRHGDEVCRIGGEEFLVICQNTDDQIGLKIGERIRNSVERCKFEDVGIDEDEKVTISLGVAAYSQGAQSVEMLLKNADLAVYEAKHTGRNRTCVYRSAQEDKRSA